MVFQEISHVHFTFEKIRKHKCFEASPKVDFIYLFYFILIDGCLWLTELVLLSSLRISVSIFTVDEYF